MSDTAELPIPDVLSLVIADCVHRDQATGKFFILGTYFAITAQSFPIQHQPFWAFLELTDGRGKTPIQLRLIDADENRTPVLTTDEFVVDFADPTAIQQIVFFHPVVVFPEPGEYRLQILVRGNPIRDRKLFVVPFPTPPTP